MGEKRSLIHLCTTSQSRQHNKLFYPGTCCWHVCISVEKAPLLPSFNFSTCILVAHGGKRARGSCKYHVTLFKTLANPSPKIPASSSRFTEGSLKLSPLLRLYCELLNHTVYRCTRATVDVQIHVLYRLPNADNVSHFMQDDSFERAIRFQVGNIRDVNLHIPLEADAVA